GAFRAQPPAHAPGGLPHPVAEQGDRPGGHGDEGVGGDASQVNDALGYQRVALAYQGDQVDVPEVAVREPRGAGVAVDEAEVEVATGHRAFLIAAAEFLHGDRQ